jgi:hypothetical protein
MPEEKPRAVTLGRNITLALFGILVGASVCVWSIQIIAQGFSPERPPISGECRPSVLDLVEAVNRARQSAAKRPTEQEAILAFRAELDAPWKLFPSIKHACSGDPESLIALTQLESLRYAEEHTVRYEARDVALWRRALQQLDHDWSKSRSSLVTPSTAH